MASSAKVWKKVRFRKKFLYLFNNQKAFRSAKSKRALELFLGSGIVSKSFENFGLEVISLDISPENQPPICTTILDWDYTAYPPHFFRVIAAGVPCNEYS